MNINKQTVGGMININVNNNYLFAVNLAFMLNFIGSFHFLILRYDRNNLLIVLCI